jgi:hypothetical protein
MNVLLLREHYADGHQDSWALMTTADFADPARPKEQYQWRATIEERHRLLKCFYDLSDFHSRSLHVITAQAAPTNSPRTPKTPSIAFFPLPTV